ncbi:MAG: hypothetical protein IJB94_05535, partial [Clostridia bacterium]|nr:hypothetical protein [Clostridia bacterium]
KSDLDEKISCVGEGSCVFLPPMQCRNPVILGIRKNQPFRHSQARATSPCTGEAEIEALRQGFFFQNWEKRSFIISSFAHIKQATNLIAPKI